MRTKNLLLSFVLLAGITSQHAIAQNASPPVVDPAPSGTEYAHDSTDGRATVETPGKDAPVSDTRDNKGGEHIDFDSDKHTGNTDMRDTAVEHDTPSTGGNSDQGASNGGGSNGGSNGGSSDGGSSDGGDGK